MRYALGVYESAAAAQAAIEEQLNRGEIKVWERPRVGRRADGQGYCISLLNVNTPDDE
jgi:hypothetical protein